MLPSRSRVRRHALSRLVAIGAILLLVMIAVVVVVQFPGILTPAPISALFLSGFAIPLIAYVGMALFATRTALPAREVAFNAAVRWGTVVGVLWWIEILEGNVWRLPGWWLSLLYFGAAIAAYLLPGFAAALVAWRTSSFRWGSLAGVWTGMVGSLLTFISGMAILWLFHASFLQDPQNLREYLRSQVHGGAPDLETYIVGDLFAGLIVHLAFIGIVLSAIAGAIGAAIGQTLHHPSRRRDKYHSSFPDLSSYFRLLQRAVDHLAADQRRRHLGARQPFRWQREGILGEHHQVGQLAGSE